MVDENDGPPLESRPPALEDLVGLCAELNLRGARYIVIGGMAVIQAGFVRDKDRLDRQFLEQLLASEDDA